MDKDKILAWMNGTPEGKAFRSELASEIVAEKLKGGEIVAAKDVDARVKAEADKARADAEKTAADQRALDEAVNAVFDIDKTIPKDKIRADLSAVEAGPARDNLLRAMKAEARETAAKNRPVGAETRLVEDDRQNKQQTEKELRAEFDTMLAEGAFGPIPSGKAEAEQVKGVLWAQFKAGRTKKKK